MKSIYKLLVVGLAALVLSGCRTAPIYNVDTAPLNASTQDLTQIEDAIKQAGAGLGWQMRPQQPGHMIGKLFLRDHVAIVDINYDAQNFSVTYNDSTNLKYDGSSIHKNYNGWIQNLERAILAQVTAL